MWSFKRSEKKVCVSVVTRSIQPNIVRSRAQRVQVLLMNDSEEIELLSCDEVEEASEAQSLEVDDLVELDLKSVIEFSTPGAMQLKRKVKEGRRTRGNYFD